MRKLLLAVLLALPAAASAQNSPTAPAPAIIVSAEQIQALAAKAAAAQAATPTPNQHETILSARPYTLNLERRIARAPAAAHSTGAELMIVLEGGATLTTGGTIVNPTVNGTTINGAEITGGASRHVVKGDFTLVPENTPHMIVPDAGAPFLQATMLIPHAAAPVSQANGGRGGALKLSTAAADLPAMIAKAKAAVPASARFFGGDTLLSYGGIRVGLEYRSPKGIASVHKNDGELMFVIAGEGHIPTGGTVVNPKDTGANIDGDAMEGATDHLMKAGDFIFVPAGLPHAAISDGEFVLATLHVPAR